MNLRSFHLVFITCASALACLVGAWALTSTALTGPARLGTAIGAIAAGLALVIYGAWFFRSSRSAR